MQPLSVAFCAYRDGMTNTKRLVAANLLDALRRRAGDQTMTRAGAETALRNLGLSTGNAQRLMDDTTDVRLGTLADAAARIGVPLTQLIGPPMGKASCKPAATPLESALDEIAARLAASDPDALDALAANLAGWAKAGGAGRWRALVEALLHDQTRKRQATG